LVSTSSIAVAQTESVNSSSIVEVLKFGWSKERIDWENDPFRGPLENFDEMRARVRNERRIADAKGGGGGADKVKREASADAANVATQHQSKPSRYVFMYKTTVRNLSSKQITSIDWDYIFLDKTTDEELGRQQFSSDEKINPGKAKELLISITRPPTQTISVTSLNKNEGDSLRGNVVVVRVTYSDGSIWQAPETVKSNP
jgi:hypothetical protein